MQYIRCSHDWMIRISRICNTERKSKMKKISRNEGLLILGQWTSKIGDIVFDYVNSIAIVSTFTNSMWILALYQNSQVVINILFNLIGGVVADLGKRKNIIIVSDCLSAIICFFASFFLNSDCMVIALVIANALLALVFSFSSPTFKSITKEIVDKNRIGFFNSISNAGIDLIKLVGPVVGFALVKVVGTRGALLIDAITFAISAGTEALLITHEHNSNSIAENTRKRKNILLYSLEGVKYLLGEKKVFHLVVLSAFVNFFLAGYDLLVPYFESNIIVVTHSGVINIIYYIINNMAWTNREKPFKVSNCSVHILNTKTMKFEEKNITYFLN